MEIKINPEPYELPICDQFIDFTCMISGTEVSAHNEVHKSNGKTNGQKECDMLFFFFFISCELRRADNGEKKK